MATVVSSLSSLPAVGRDAAPSSELGKSDFLRLLTTQLTAQDPLAPMDSQEFVAQLAQFASLEQLQGVGERLDTMLLGQASANQMGVANLVGKEVLYRTDRVALAGEGSSAAFSVTLADGVDEGAAILADASGRVVRTIPLGVREAGTFQLTWDGRDDAGRPLPAGEYTLTVAATRDGAPVSARAQVRGTVAAVTFENGAPELVVAGGRVRLADVIEISTLLAP